MSKQISTSEMHQRNLSLPWLGAEVGRFAEGSATCKEWIIYFASEKR